MSWQADIKRLHEKSSSLGIDLTEFEDELRNDEGWYTESNIQEFIECQNLQLAKQQEEIAELVDLLDRVCGHYESEEIAHHFGIDHESALLIVNKLAKHNKGE